MTESINQPKTIHQQLMALENRSNTTLHALDAACEDLRALEGELERFLSNYYGRVGGYFEQLQKIEQELEAFRATYMWSPAQAVLENAKQFNEVTSKELSKQLDDEMKQLYRSMAKEYHPDAPRGEQAVAQMKEDVIKTINNAYARRNIGELWKIKWEMERAAAQTKTQAHEKMVQLERHCEKMQQSLHEVQRRRKKLEQSPAYALMQRAFQLRLCGQDFIEIVTSNVMSQIEARRRELVNTKIKQLYVNELTPTHSEAVA